jgi:hypothetical protein
MGSVHRASTSHFPLPFSAPARRAATVAPARICPAGPRQHSTPIKGDAFRKPPSALHRLFRRATFLGGRRGIKQPTGWDRAPTHCQATRRRYRGRRQDARAHGRFEQGRQRRPPQLHATVTLSTGATETLIPGNEDIAFPLGTMFAYISQNWRGKSLVSHKIIIQLIAAPRPAKDLQ